MASKRTRASALALFTVVALIALLAPPFAGGALASHGNQRLEVSPEVDQNPQGTNHTLAATLYQGDTDTVGGATNATGPVVVDFSITSGPNAGETYSCTIVVGDSSCSVTYPGDAGPGTDTIRAVIRGHTADTGEGRYAGPTDCVNEPAECTSGNPQPGGTAEDQGDSTDVVQKTWTQVVTGAVCLDADPNGDTNPSGSEHTITLRVTDGNKAADQNDSFNCTGTARPNTQVNLTLSDDDPNAFFNTVNGVSTNPSGGGPDSVTCTTNANGECTVTIKTVDPAATGTNAVTATVPGTSDPNATETVQKTWAPAGQPSEVDAVPESDTNETGQAHQVSATVRDQFGNPVPGQRVSFQVTGGPHSDNDLDNDANTPNGYFGSCTADANGRCSASYTGSELGTDTIRVFIDANSNFQFDGGETSDQVSKTWVAPGQGTTRVRLDMEGCDGDRNAPVDETTWDEQAQPNPAGTVHEICAERFDALDQPQAGPVTFTITSGPGFFTNAAGSANLGNTITVDESGDGYVHAFVRSNEVGTTVVEAREANATDTGSKPWVSAAANARNIDLEPETATNPPATEHEVVAQVTDRFGNPVPGVTVTFTESGPGRFVSGGSSVTETTDANGEARARTTTAPNEEGDQQITATIDPDTTDCELPANQPDQGDPAGNCSDTVVKTWGEPQPTACPGFEGDPRNQIVGDEGDNVITGTGGDDIICGLGGDDTIDGAGGNDLILGGRGNDTIDAGEGSDTVRGGAGNDLIRGGLGEDNLSGGSGDDQVRGGADDDAILGGEGKDNLLGGAGDDAISGNRGHDLILGGSGNDSLKGNRGNDTLRGQTGNDTLQGGSGDDILRGGSGNDTLRGYTGDDLLNGGPGTDTCRPGRGADRVTNCEL